MVRAACALALLATPIACASSQSETLPPYGEALVFVDTDLAVPALASRLRVDLYDETGRWFESRDIGRADPRDWPASFSVFSDDEEHERRVLVRLRAYPEGTTRDYLGERWAGRTRYVEPHVATDIDDLCARAPELPMGGRVTLRQGPTVITQHALSSSCKVPARSGAVAARVAISQAGTYRFAVADAAPFTTYTTLSIRESCTEPGTQGACRSGSLDGTAYFTAGHFPRFDVGLVPGTYWVLADGMSPDWPADVTLEAMPVDLPLPSSPAPIASAPRASGEPRLVPRALVAPSVDPTPKSEPVPSAAVDRLLLVRLVPGRRDKHHVVLRGACAGSMAKLGEVDRPVAAAAARTCIDAARLDAPLTEAIPVEAPPPNSAQGTFAIGDPCPPGASTPERVCVPGGAFLLGSRLQISDVSNVRRPTPERLVAVSRFLLDRNEVTVSRFREAVARGFVAKRPAIYDNPQPIELDFQRPEKICTWSERPLGREDYAVSCMTWGVARAFCKFVGGDLPTEAQWEYAAGAAGRPFETVFPWGDDPPACDRAVFERIDPPCQRLDGTTVPIGPAPVTAADGSNGAPGDVTPLGIVNMTGGLVEWIRDSAQPYDGPCWAAASVLDPVCDETNAPSRGVKGGHWAAAATPSFARASSPAGWGGEDPLGVGFADPRLGFRCAYEAPR